MLVRFLATVFPAALLAMTFFVQSSYGDFSLTMTGTIATGSLNGANIDGQFFTLTSEIVSPAIDSEPNTEIGIFALSSSVIEIEGNGNFVFNDGDLYYGQAAISGSFEVAILDAPTLASMDRNFGFSTDSNLPTIDPNLIQSFFYSSFTNTVGDFDNTFTNIAGDILEIDLFVDVTGASIRVVPEPCTFGVLGLFGLGLVIRRKK